MSKRHLHRDYNTAFCGKDASHILMTDAVDESDCTVCQTAYRNALSAAAKAAAREEKERTDRLERLRREQEEAEQRAAEREELDAALREMLAERRAARLRGESGDA